MDETTTDTPTQEQRNAAAAAWIEGDGVNATTEPVEPAEPEGYDDCSYDAAGGMEWLILTDDEADARVRENVERDLWAFNADFLAAYMPEGIDAAEINAIRGDRCEDANAAMVALVKAADDDGLDRITEDAIQADGRGHFLAGYDGHECEFDHAGRLWYAYRTN